MLEVCFHDSVKGALAFLQHGGEQVFTDKNRQIESEKQAFSANGEKEDVAGISLGLSQGDIQSPLCLEDCPRKEYIRSMFSFGRRNEPGEIETFVQTFWANCMEDLEKLKSGPQKIRVWLDHTPDAQCGLLFIADLFKDSETEIHVVELPQCIKKADGSFLEYHGFHEVEPQMFGSFLEKERVLAHKEVLGFANRWQLLKRENAPLRVVENGVVISAGISYYDDFIRNEFPQEACKIANIIGRVLFKQKILAGDVLIAKRIQRFIENGELVVLEKSQDGFYRTVVSRA